MQIRTSLPASKEQCVLALGNFDGVHLGHRRLFEFGLKQAVRLGVEFSVLILEPHPFKVLFPERELKLLSTPGERLSYFEMVGVQTVYSLPFTRETANTTAEEFVENILLPLGVVHVVVGFNYSFGAKGKGTPELLQVLGKKLGFGVSVFQAQTIGGMVISSSGIRKALGQGDVRLAGTLLGRRPCLRGTVVRGDERGRLLGYPTANIYPDEDYLIPKRGVYAVWAELEGSRVPGMMNIGVKPTFHDEDREVVEINFFGFDGDLYGKEILVHIVERLRDERKFNGAGELLMQLKMDKVQADALFDEECAYEPENEL